MVIVARKYRAPNGRYYRSRTAYLRQLRAMFANMPYQRKGRRKSRLHKNLSRSRYTLKKQQQKKIKRQLTIAEKRKIAERELKDLLVSTNEEWTKAGVPAELLKQSDDIYPRIVRDIEKGLIPSRESYDRVELAFSWAEYDPPEKWPTDEPWDEIKERADNGDKEAQKKLIDETLWKMGYHAEEDPELGVVAVADDKAVNTGRTEGAPIGLRYDLFLGGTYQGDNFMGDGTLITPEILYAVYDNVEDRFLMASELKQIKFDKRGVQPKIYQLLDEKEKKKLVSELE